MKQHVLFILHLPPPVHGAAIVGKYIHDSRLVNETFDCHYVNLSMAASISDVGHFRVGKLKGFWHLLRRIRGEVRQVKPSLVYITPNARGGAFYKEFVIVMMLKSMGCRVVAHYHNKGVRSAQGSWLYNWLYTRFFSNLSVMLLADGLYDDVSRYVSRSCVYVCPNGIADNGVMKHETVKKPVPTLMFLSNLLKAKGVFDMLDACLLLKQRGLGFRSVFVGAESDEISRETFTREVRRRGLQGTVSYVGSKYGKEKDAYWADAEVFVLPSHNECFPLVLLEAMSHGVPCVSTTEGAIPEIIDDGVTGYVVHTHAPEELAGKIATLIEDDGLRRKMGQKGREKYERNYTLKRFEARFVEIMLQLIGADA